VIAAFMYFFTRNPAHAVNSAANDNELRHIATSGWSTGYALSIYGQEMYQNCPSTPAMATRRACHFRA